MGLTGEGCGTNTATLSSCTAITIPSPSGVYLTGRIVARQTVLGGVAYNLMFWQVRNRGIQYGGIFKYRTSNASFENRYIQHNLYQPLLLQLAEVALFVKYPSLYKYLPIFPQVSIIITFEPMMQFKSSMLETLSRETEGVSW